MFSFLSNLLGAVGHFFDYLKQKRLADAVEDKVLAEGALGDEKEQHKRTKEIHGVEINVRDVKQKPIKNYTRRLEG